MTDVASGQNPDADATCDVDLRTMRLVQAGRLEQFAQIVGRHQSRLFRYAVSRLGCRSLAEDAVQQTFLAIFRSRASFNPDRGFRAWLWRIHANECSRLARSQIRNRIAEAEYHANSGECDVEPAESKIEQREQLAELLARLPAEQAEAVRLRYFGELNFVEVAATTGVNPATAKSRVRYALAKMAEAINAKLEQQS